MKPSLPHTTAAPTVPLGELSRLSGYSERSLRRAVERIRAEGGDLEAKDGRVGGADLPLLLAALHELATEYRSGQGGQATPPIHEHFDALRQRRERGEAPVLPEPYAALLQAPAKRGPAREEPPAPRQAEEPDAGAPRDPQDNALARELARLNERLGEFGDRLGRLELRLSHLEGRFAAAERGLRSVELLPDDEEAEGSLYALVTGLLGAFNDRLGAVERQVAQATGDMASIALKLADNDKELRNLLRDLLAQLSPR
ncbi:hypothetical protein [Calidithermus chliarophilus]|jgi:hypothetical protein|uniref:hypothetical protein n=1 Tax=Calidithermus chliarophilus TaxID=52023 RepID=UPI0003FF0A02|nr:hypothetical protein [Calidithermus chliarophilus]